MFIWLGLLWKYRAGQRFFGRGKGVAKVMKESLADMEELKSGETVCPAPSSVCPPVQSLKLFKSGKTLAAASQRWFNNFFPPSETPFHTRTGWSPGGSKRGKRRPAPVIGLWPFVGSPALTYHWNSRFEFLGWSHAGLCLHRTNWSLDVYWGQS